jgi:hypothetical protein
MFCRGDLVVGGLQQYFLDATVVARCLVGTSFAIAIGNPEKTPQPKQFRIMAG